MHPRPRDHHHLRILLSDRHGVTTAEAPADPFTKEFLETLAGERIRLRRSDWQGRPVIALVWHYPDLRPAVQAMVGRHVAGRWQEYRNQLTTDAPTPVNPPPRHRRPASDRRFAKAHPSVAPPAIPIHAQPPSLARPIASMDRGQCQRDWFDRLTDWMAAIVTLWK